MGGFEGLCITGLAVCVCEARVMGCDVRGRMRIETWKIK